MLAEIQAAAAYLASHLDLPRPQHSSSGKSEQEEALTFTTSFVHLLQAKYAGHWHANDPERGSAYRAVTRSGSYLDQLIVDALTRTLGPDATILSKDVISRTAATQLAQGMQSDRWTLWIDPGCVSIRLREGGLASGVTFDNSAASAAKVVTRNGALSGIQEIWGRLPAHLVGHAQLASDSIARTKTPFELLAAGSPAAADKAAALSEFAELMKEANASPSKRSKAIAIVRPRSVLANDARAPVRATTPPPPLPPLHFTIEESTSPYVPSFAPHPHAIAGNANANASGASSTRSTTPTPLVSSPLSNSSSVDSDPFARPSSRTSTTSAESAASCSIFSHSSHESRSSSIGSFSTMASSAGAVGIPSLSSMAGSILKATPSEMNQAALFTFPSSLSAPGSKSCPVSPSKSQTARRAAVAGPPAPRHQHTLSTSSAVSASSNTSGSGGASHPVRPGHVRGRSSQSSIRVSTASAHVQDYSNGKVGVLGGGVLLGLGGGNRSSTSASGSGNGSGERKRSTNSRPGSASSGTSTASLGDGSGRQRSKSRTPSASGSVHGHGAATPVPAWYNSHHYHPVPAVSQHWMQGQA